MRAIIAKLLLALVIASVLPAIAAAQNGPAPENALRQGAQAAPDPVALDRIPDLARDGQTDPDPGIRRRHAA